MSVHYSSAVWKWRAPEPSTKLVLLHLADLANHEGLCWPTQARICAETGLSKSTVNDKLNWLVGRGIIGRESGNSARNSRYLISMAKLEAETGEQSDSRTLQLLDSPTTGPRQSDSRTILVRQPDHLSPTAGHHPSVPVSNPSVTHQGELLPQSPGSVRSSSVPETANGPTSPHCPTGEAGSPQKKEGGRARDLCFEALVEIQGSRLKEIARSERGQINRALKEIREVAPDLTPAELKKRAAAFRERMPNLTLNAMVLATWWSRLGAGGSGHGSAVEAAPVMLADVEGPEGWRGAVRELYGDEIGSMWPNWMALPRANQNEVRACLAKKRKGAA